MAARKYSVGIGPVPVPPALSGSSTSRSNPAAVTRHRQPPSQRATTEFVSGWSACVVMVVREHAGTVPGRPGREHGRPGPQILGRHQPTLADKPLQGPQPAPVITPVVLRRAACLPRSDLGDQALPEVLPVDPPGLLQRQREAEG